MRLAVTGAGLSPARIYDIDQPQPRPVLAIKVQTIIPINDSMIDRLLNVTLDSAKAEAPLILNSLEKGLLLFNSAVIVKFIFHPMSS